MVIGEAPGRDEDLAGLPFVGRSGQLLDRMLAAIGLSRRAEDPAHAAYITNVLPWRPPQNRDPSGDEVAMLTPFLFRHIELAAPGGAAAARLAGGAHRARHHRRRDPAARPLGDWRGVPALATFHPAALLRDADQEARGLGRPPAAAGAARRGGDAAEPAAPSCRSASRC